MKFNFLLVIALLLISSVDCSSVLSRSTEYGEDTSLFWKRVKESFGHRKRSREEVMRNREKLLGRVMTVGAPLRRTMIDQVGQEVLCSLQNDEILSSFQNNDNVWAQGLENLCLSDKEQRFIITCLTPAVVGRRLSVKRLPEWLQVGMNVHGESVPFQNYNEEYVRALCPDKTDAEYEQLAHIVALHVGGYFYVMKGSKADLDRFQNNNDRYPLERYVKYAEHDVKCRAFFDAADRGSVDDLRGELEAGATVTMRDVISCTALVWAIDSSCDRLKKVKLLLEFGADPNIIPSYSIAPSFKAPLLLAVERGYLEIVKVLLAGGADPNVCFVGETALLIAVRENNLGIIKLSQSVTQAFVDTGGCSCSIQ